MTREEAITYLQSSGFSEEQIKTIENAFGSAEGEYIKKEDALKPYQEESTQIWMDDVYKHLNGLPTYSFPEVVHIKNDEELLKKLKDENGNLNVVVPTDMEVWDGYHGQMVAPKGTFDKLFEEAKESDEDDGI